MAIKTIKTYLIKGKQASLLFKLGDATLRAEFTNSFTTQGGTFTTANPLAQLVIETSPMFKSGNITIYAVSKSGTEDAPKAAVKTDEDEKKPAKKAKSESQAKTKEVHEDVTEVNEVIDILKEKGMDYKMFSTKEKMLDTIERLNLSFPNVDFK
jgi:hypothetical protein